MISIDDSIQNQSNSIDPIASNKLHAKLPKQVKLSKSKSVAADFGKSVGQRSYKTIQEQPRNVVKSIRSIDYRSRVTSIKTITAHANHNSLGKSMPNQSLRVGSQTEKKLNSYEIIARELKARLPTPRQKFLQFLEIPPFNRSLNHMELITHFLKKYRFFRMHPPELIEAMARKVVLLKFQNIDQKMLVVVQQGSCQYIGQAVTAGNVIARHSIKKKDIMILSETSFIGLYWHQYRSFLSSYLTANYDKYRKFLSSLQIFKVFSQKSFDKICTNLSLFFFNQGQVLYRTGDQATHLFVVQTGRISRRVIVQIDKTNKIPVQRYTKKVKIISRSYEHKVAFNREDLVGVADILQSRPVRKQLLHVQQNTVLIGIDRNVLQENLDEYISDRLLQYNNKKYPENYDCLCQNYMKEKMQARKTEQRKIAALQDAISNNYSQQRNSKINSIIKLYQNRIKQNQIRNLIGKKKEERDVIQN